MTSGRTIRYVAGGGLLVAWLAAANMPAQDTDRSREPVRPADPVPTAAIAEEVHSQAARLQARMAQAPIPESNPRNPFAFGTAPRGWVSGSRRCGRATWRVCSIASLAVSACHHPRLRPSGAT